MKTKKDLLPVHKRVKSLTKNAFPGRRKCEPRLAEMGCGWFGVDTDTLLHHLSADRASSEEKEGVLSVLFAPTRLPENRTQSSTPVPMDLPSPKGWPTATVLVRHMA